MSTITVDGRPISLSEKLMTNERAPLPSLRAKDRCKEHSAGDRCRKPLGHEETDAVHEGQFTLWQRGKFREEKFARKAPKTDRGLKRFVRGLRPKDARYVPDKSRSAFLAALNRAITTLRGAA